MFKRGQITAIVLAILLCLFLLLSACVLAREVRHDCIGDNCAICCVIQICENVLRIIGKLIARVFIGIPLGLSIYVFLYYRCYCSFDTLVSKKVKLSN